ncbi:MAG: sirohydrochlorin cobaltochelatase [Desulfobacterota bacterium]|nr:sirohydrochlorin cobaltochelatase [Thermodesulfobacteriota bacterium]
MNEKSAIILAAFGTSGAGRKTYGRIYRVIQEQFPQCDVFLAYTSKKLCAAFAARGAVGYSLDEVLSTVITNGSSRVVVQSLHIVPGYEYEKIIAAARCAAVPVAVGEPLLASDEDCRTVINALAPYLKPEPGSAVVLAGHGTRHPRGAAMYARFAECLYAHSPDGIFLAMVEGEPSWQRVRALLSKRGVRRVFFIPFMLVAGEHIEHDVLGADNSSWVASLEGIEIQALMEGLGNNSKILDLFVTHIRTACRLWSDQAENFCAPTRMKNFVMFHDEGGL